MGLVINTNTQSLTSQRYLGMNTMALGKSMEKLSSGFRINRAADDAAGLQLSERLRSQIRGSAKALANVQDGINLLNITDGAYNQVIDNVQRMRELAVQAANDTYDTNQRAAMQSEFNQLRTEITRISDSTQFNGIFLLNGSLNATGLLVQVGPNPGDILNLHIGNFSDIDTVVPLGLDIQSSGAANGTIGALDATGINVLGSFRGLVGALTNRLEGTANNLAISIENLSASESRIRNVDVAAESANLVRNQILQQASASMLAQANQAPGLALKLLGG